jgi:cell division protease FtsH
MGMERRSLVLSEEERRNTAYHEAGHAFVARMMPGSDPIHKVTIIPRGRALGVTQQLPIDDRHTYAKDYLLAQIAVLMGGRASEEMFLNHMTTGAGNDIQRATELARKMVCEWGMSDALGPLTFGQKEEQIFLGKEFARHRDFSEETAMTIDTEIRRFVTENYKRAASVIAENKGTVQKIAEALLERETLNSQELEVLMEGRELPPMEKPISQAKDKEKAEVTQPDRRDLVMGTPTSAPDPGKP